MQKFLIFSKKFRSNINIVSKIGGIILLITGLANLKAWMFVTNLATDGNNLNAAKAKIPNVEISWELDVPELYRTNINNEI